MTELRPLDELRESFREAAHREMGTASPPPATRRRGRFGRPLLAIGVALTVAGGVAAAADLISVGSPKPDRPRASSVLPAGEQRIDVTAADTPLSWGVRSYEARDGRTCVVVGQVRANVLGVVAGGTFRPYEESRGGPCVDLERRSRITDVRRFPDRTILYGQAAPRVAKVEIREGGASPAVARTGRRGAFLFVFRGELDTAKLRTEAFDRRGRIVAP